MPKSDQAELIDRALDAILARARLAGGLALTIRQAREICELAKVKGIEKAEVEFARRPGFSPVDLSDFASDLRVQVLHLAAELEEGEGEGDDGEALTPETDPAGKVVVLDSLSDEQLRAEGKRYGVRNWHTMKRENLLEALRGLDYFVADSEEE